MLLVCMILSLTSLSFAMESPTGLGRRGVLLAKSPATKGMKNQEIGVLMGVDYSTVSQGRKRLAEKRRKDKKLDALVTRLEGCLSRIKI